MGAETKGIQFKPPLHPAGVLHYSALLTFVNWSALNPGKSIFNSSN